MARDKWSLIAVLTGGSLVLLVWAIYGLRYFGGVDLRAFSTVLVEALGIAAIWLYFTFEDSFFVFDRQEQVWLGLLMPVITVGLLLRLAALVRWWFLTYINTTNPRAFGERLFDFFLEPVLTVVAIAVLVGLLLWLLSENEENPKSPRPNFPRGRPSDPRFWVAAVALVLGIVLVLKMVPMPLSLAALLLAVVVGVLLLPICLAGLWFLAWVMSLGWFETESHEVVGQKTESYEDYKGTCSMASRRADVIRS